MCVQCNYASHFSYQIESVKKEVGQKLLDRQEKLHQLWVSWCLTQPKGHQVKTASKVEVYTGVCNQTSCEWCASHLLQWLSYISFPADRITDSSYAAYHHSAATTYL